MPNLTPVRSTKNQWTTNHRFDYVADDDVFICRYCFASTYDLPENYDSQTLGECIEHK